MPYPYERKSSDPLRNAQQNLAGRTHYVDADTLRYFRARILSTHATDNGLLFAVVESCSGDHEYKTRIFRHVIFDIFGTVIDRPSMNEKNEKRIYKSQAPAMAAMWRALESIDAGAVTRAAIESHRAAYERELSDLTNRLEAIEAKKSAAARVPRLRARAYVTLV